MKLIYIRPAFGGILDYAEAMLRVLRQQHSAAEIRTLTVPWGPRPWVEGRRLAHEIASSPGIVWAELGVGDRAMFWALHHLPRHRDLVLTVHDPGVVINQPFRLPFVSGGPPGVHDACFHAARILNGPVARLLFRRVLRRARTRIVLNEAVHDLWGCSLTYLPHPLHSDRIARRGVPSQSCIAFAGYWGATKGLDDLLEAYKDLLPRFPGARFVIAGDAALDDPWARAFRARARAASDRIELPGFIPAAQFGAFLSEVTALVLPYRSDVPGAASGMLMRAQEAAVPLIISDTPLLRAQVDTRNVTIIPPRDARALGTAISQHLRDPDPAHRRAVQEQARVHAKHGDAEVGRRVRAVLDAIAAPVTEFTSGRPRNAPP